MKSFVLSFFFFFSSDFYPFICVFQILQFTLASKFTTHLVNDSNDDGRSQFMTTEVSGWTENDSMGEGEGGPPPFCSSHIS
jgi:hypothetical protein